MWRKPTNKGIKNYSLMEGRSNCMYWLILGVVVLFCGHADGEFTFGTPTNLGSVINSSSLEACPRISPDGLSLYFCSQRPGGYGGTDIWVSTRKSLSADWEIPTNLGASINSTYEEVFPELWNNGLTLYFASNRPGGYGWLDIYVTKRTTIDGPWDEPVNLGPVINAATAQDGHSLSADGLTMYFVSGANWPGTVGGYDMWVTTRATVLHPWGTPVNLGPSVNSSSDDYTTDLSADELMLFFQSLRPGGYGLADLYVTRRKTKSDPWETPVNLGSPVNTSASEGTPNISADGSTLYFHSDRAGTLGNWDLWQVTVNPEPKCGDTQHPHPLSDINQDCRVDMLDFAILCSQWLQDNNP